MLYSQVRLQRNPSLHRTTLRLKCMRWWEAWDLLTGTTAYECTP